MPKIKVLPHAEICPQGACTTCHVIFTEGFNSLNDSSDDEEDLLDKAWGLEPKSRLSCQTIVEDTDLEILIPKYTINMVSENHPKPSKDSKKEITSIDFDISKTAASHLTEMINANNSLGIRISLEDSGCSGFAYQVDLIDVKDKNDLAGLVNGVNLFIHEKSFVFLKGTKLDFVKKNLNQELVFLNPNVSAECGCGESFNFDNELVKELSNN